VWNQVRSALDNAQTEAAGASGSQVVRGAVSIDLPSEACVTSEKGDMPRYDWQITLRAHARGPDYKATYPIVLT
jgi:hypothetical protein